MSTALRAFCRRILECGDLDAKLAPAEADVKATAAVAEPALWLAAPARSPSLALRTGADPLPRPGELGSGDARARCLARFAHHELMAVELFAWALLRWPALPVSIRRGWLATLADEQRHCSMYLERLRAHGSRLEEHVLSDYFWKHAPAIAASPHGPSAFLCAMGLTLEQANLDFTLLYRDGFREAGDEQTARVCQHVHDDEVVHVRRAWIAFGEISPDDADAVDGYAEAVPFPLAAARAKGRRFDVAARRRAGLSDRFIEHVRVARSSAELAPRSRPPRG